VKTESAGLGLAGDRGEFKSAGCQLDQDVSLLLHDRVVTTSAGKCLAEDSVEMESAGWRLDAVLGER
jgi:hypothetical protein